MVLRVTLAQFILLSASGCAEMHGRGDDTGATDATSSSDASALSDAGSLDAPAVDAGAAGCGPEDASAVTCAATCDGPPSWHWNGDRCEPIDCGACTGADCAGAPRTEAECLAAHATCDATLCRATGGEWLFWAEECGHRACGQPVPAICESGFAVCDCGPNGRFAPGVGCETDGLCPEPPPRTREELCTATGGAWESVCCDSVCGEACGDDCVAPACTCGPMQIFDPARGCRDATVCWDRDLDASCAGGARCPSGAICCEHCGGAGCFGPPTCEIPICDDDPTIDECGNNLLAP